MGSVVGRKISLKLVQLCNLLILKVSRNTSKCCHDDNLFYKSSVNIFEHYCTSH